MGQKEKSFGNIIEPDKITNKCNLFKYTNFDVFQDLNCKECKCLPICMGGCPSERLNFDRKMCHPYKFYSEKILTSYINTLTSEN